MRKWGLDLLEAYLILIHLCYSINEELADLIHEFVNEITLNA